MADRTHKDNLDTPALIVNLDAMRHNITDMADFASAHHIRLRPHAKTHKTPTIGKMQLEAGAVGVTLAKLGEAEVFADAGFTDILIAYPLVGALKHRRLLALMERATITVTLDHVDIADSLSRTMAANGREIAVMVEVDTGMGRCGAQPGETALDIALHVARLPGLRLAGLLTHEGHAQFAGTPEQVRSTSLSAGEMMTETANLIRRVGVDVPVISVGSTATAKLTSLVEGVTEIRPGIYVFYDRGEMLHGLVPPERCAARVLATVASRPAPDRLILDAGSKALSSDGAGFAPPVGGFGYVVGYPDWNIRRLSEEHGIVSVSPDDAVQIGERVEIIPNHICPVMNLFDAMFITQGDEVIDRWPVAARGKSQ
ncbi:MAG: alanine racemase [Burkholderiales bacterium]|nr:alanine racemase [Anaerolineae bacterium]